MAFKYGTTSPTAIKYNGTDLTVLKYGTTAVWGKPYSLSISAGTNTSVTVTRTSSPNQRASTGTLSSGSVVYYGDVLTISYSVSSGYKINTATVNGTSFTSGQSFTVTSAISVVTTAVASASWKTVWTGNATKSWSTLHPNSANVAIEAPTSLTPNVPTRINCSIDWCGADEGDESRFWVEVNGSATGLKDLPLNIYGGYYGNEQITITKVSNYGVSGTFKSFFDCVRVMYFNYGMVFAAGMITFTRIDQYV